MKLDPKSFLAKCFDIALNAAMPHSALPQLLPKNRSNPVIVIGAGKAAASMAATFEKHWHGTIAGLVVTPYNHSEKCEHIETIEASHPTPDHVSVEAASRILELTAHLTEDDQVFVLLSGGGSSLLCSPPKGISLQEKKTIHKALLKSGADIQEMNIVRKHLSTIKGGRLLTNCFPAKVHTFAISDVPGNDPSVIASGPTIADPTSSQDAIQILNKYNIDVPQSIKDWLNCPASETLKPENQVFEKSKYTVIATAENVLNAVHNYAIQCDIDCINLGEQDGDARLLGEQHAKLALQTTAIKPTLIISGGETTVTVKGRGKGGRNGEYLLSLALSLKGNKNIYALAADTDGIDGMETNAGAHISPDTFTRAKELNLNLEAMLDNNDSYTAFKMLDDLFITGPTRTNVNDFRAILILPI